MRNFVVFPRNLPPQQQDQTQKQVHFHMTDRRIHTKTPLYTPFRGGHSQISSVDNQKTNICILNVNPVQTNIRTEVVQILGRNPRRTAIKRPFLEKSLSSLTRGNFSPPFGPFLALLAPFWAFFGPF